MNKTNRMWRRIIVLAICAMILAVFGSNMAGAQDGPTLESLQASVDAMTISIDTSWVLITGFLVFFMQTGFALLETGLVRQKGTVNALLENFIDAGLTAVVWWAVGFGIAFGASQGGLFGTSMFAPGIEMASTAFTYSYPDGSTFSLYVSTLTFFFFQFAFAATASTITTGAMAERTDFVGDLIYSALIAIFIYPVIVHWVWSGSGWLFQMGFHDFAGGTVVHTVGGVIALVGAIMLGPRPGRVFGKPPRPHNLALATLGTMILWFGWFGFNPGSTLGLGGGAPEGVGTFASWAGLITINTTLGGAAGGLLSMFFQFFRTGKWDLTYALNGTLAGLVAITPACAYVSPLAAIIIGSLAGILVILVADAVEAAKIDDAVGAFAVHGACGMMGTMAIGFWADPTLTFNTLMAGKAGLFLGGGVELLGVQVIGSLATVAYVAVTSVLMFGLLKVINRLRVSSKADAVGIDVYEHGASLWPDVLPHPDDVAESGSPKRAPAVGD
jgi:Amt family ammonium transporter